MKVKLKEIVGLFVNSKGGSQHEMARLYNMASKRGMKVFNLEISGRVKSVLLDVSPNRTIALPEDYVTYSKVGVVDELGEIYAFKHNERLTALRGDIIHGTTAEGYERSSIFSNFYVDGSNYNILGYALATPTIGTFKVDEEAGVIRVDANCPFDQIVLEYLPDGFDDTEKDHCLDFRVQEAFICWLRWQNAVDLNKQYTQNDVRGFKREFYRERRNAKWKLNPVIISEMENVRRNSIKLVAKA